MGGLGSGQRRWRLGVDESRALEVGELCDQGRWQSQPCGEVLWRSRRGGVLCARLTYVITRQENAAGEFLLAYRYWPLGEGSCRAKELRLEVLPGQRSYAYCPACGRRVRTLYAPGGAELFACRSCYRLAYRRSHSADDLARVIEAAGPAMRELEALPRRTRRRPRRRYVAAPPAALAQRLEEEPPLGEAGARLWCLRLRAAGLSYRQIAALTESSKSSVARICVAGKRAIDVQELVRECLERAAYFPPPPEGHDRRALATYLADMHRHDLRRGLYRRPLIEPERRLVIPRDTTAEL